MASDPANTTAFINGIDLSKIDKHPNILIAASFWDDERYHAAKVCYQFMREIDDMVDDWKSGADIDSCMERELLTQKVSKWIQCLDKRAADDPAMLELIDTIKAFKIPLFYFHNFTVAMQYDIDHSGFDSFDSFLKYAEGASVAPASIFVHLCCLSKEKGEYILPPIDVLEVARPCAIFSYLVHVIRDFVKDQNENLNYFALDVLEKHKLSTKDLKEIASSGTIPDNFRDVIGFYKEKAEVYRQQTVQQLDKLTSMVNGKYMLSLNIIYQLYLNIFNRIDVENGTFTAEELKPSNEEIGQMVLHLIS